MAILSLLAGGMVGFLSALISLILLNASWMSALAVWSGIGILVAALILIVVLLQRKPKEILAMAQHA